MRQIINSFVIIALLFFIIFILLAFMSCRRRTIFALNTQTLEQKQYNSAPKRYEYKEIFLAKGENNTFWGALRGINGNGDLFTCYDLTTGKKIKSFNLPYLGIATSHMSDVLYPKSLDFVYEKASYSKDGKKIGPYEIIKYNIEDDKKNILYTMRDTKSYGSIAYRNEKTLLIIENLQDGEDDYNCERYSKLIILDINTNSQNVMQLPDSIYSIDCVSSSGKYALISSFKFFLLIDLERLKIVKIFSTLEKNLFEGSFSPDETKIVFNTYCSPKIFIYDVLEGKECKKLLRGSSGEEIYSPRFLTNNMIIYRSVYNNQDSIVFFCLEKGKIERKIIVDKIFSPLFVIEEYIVFED